ACLGTCWLRVRLAWGSALFSVCFIATKRHKEQRNESSRNKRQGGLSLGRRVARRSDAAVGARRGTRAHNAVGRLVQDLIYQGGVDQSHLQWVKFDGVGRTVRNGLNFTERGFGVRAAAGCSDRGHTAVSQLKPGDIDWEKIFGAEG